MPRRLFDDQEALAEADQHREEEAQREREVYASLFSSTPQLSKLAQAVHKPVHVEGGPCVKTAGPDEKFVSVQYQMIDRVLGRTVISEAVTCELCKVAIALTEGDTRAEEPDPYAKAVGRAVHATLGGSVIVCGASVAEWHVEVLVTYRAADFERVTCKECIALLRKGGYLK
jgi:hypothetical protein